MTTRKKSCCVPGCEDKTSVRHRIPTAGNICDVWLKRIANVKLYDLPKEIVNNNYKICDKHFIPQCKNLGSSQLKLYSLPSVNLPGFSEEGNSENSFLYPPEIAKKLQEPRLIEELSTQRQDCGNEISSSFIVPSVRDGQITIGNSNAIYTISCADQANRYIKSYGKRSCNVFEESALATMKKPHQEAPEPLDSLSSQNEQVVIKDHCSGDDTATSNNGHVLKTPRKRNHGISKQGSVLKGVGVTRRSDLTPKASMLYDHVTKLKKVSKRLDKKVKSFKGRMRLAEKFSTSDCFENLATKVDKVTYNFIKSQVANQCHRARGRRFTCEDKIFALSLLKASPKGHKFLSKYFALPSRRTLVILLGKIPFHPGINAPIMNHLKIVVSGMSDSDKHCVLLFDEMKLQTHLQFNEKLDVIEGFEDYGGGETSKKFANHALVFMLRGLRGKWKQPVAYYFVESTTKTPILVRCIKEVVKEILSCGLQLVATVCDQAGTNVAAINSLLDGTRAKCLRNNEVCYPYMFEIEGANIVPLFDPPHMLKGIRNNLLSKNLVFQWKKDQQTASWGHLERFYAIDSSQMDGTSTCPRLTDEHVKPEHIKKMKVRNCAQVFSQRVSSVMRMLAKWGKSDLLPPEAEDTADLFLFLDMLFDSVNGSSVKPKKGKLLRCAVSCTSPHHEFWIEAIRVLRTFKFVNSNGKYCRPPSVKNWELTLQGINVLWSSLQKKGFKFLSLRALNQDPLENFFGCIRSHGVRNVMPSCTSFISSFKTLLVNNFTSPHSVGSNCMEDDTQGSLDTLKVFLTHSVSHEQPKDVDSGVSFEHLPCFSKVDELQFSPTDSNPLSLGTKVYINGYVARRVMKNIGNCADCRENLFSTGPVENSEIITARSYTPTSLRYPNTGFSNICVVAAQCVFKNLPVVCHLQNIKNILTTLILLEIDTHAFTCKKHDLCKRVLDVLVRLYVHSWCKSINRLLSGKVTSADHTEDEVKKAAIAKYRCGLKRKSQVKK